MVTQECRICGNTENNRPFLVKEMMFGLKDEFEYLECNECGCLQIKDIPPNIAHYYPENYYSYQNKGEAHFIRRSPLKTAKRILKKKALRYYLTGSSWIGKVVASKYSSYYPWLKKELACNDSKILDIGCGAGELLLRMHNDGFTNISGVDPFINRDINYTCGVTIHKKNLTQLTEQYDLIMMHHAFEHMDAPLSVLEDCNSLLTTGGKLLIRVPVAASYAWRTYGVNWVQLDAPRHFFLHTQKSMELLSKQSGFVITHIEYDSYDLQFVGSEKYKQGLALVDETDIFFSGTT